MKGYSMTPPVRRRARGMANIELALILMLMAILLPLIFSFGQIFYVFAALKQASSNAAASLAAVPMAEWVVGAPESSTMKVRAKAIANQTLAETGVTPALSLDSFTITCRRTGMPGSGCGGTDRPEWIMVNLEVNMPMLGVMNMFHTGGSLLIISSVTVPYTN